MVEETQNGHTLRHTHDLISGRRQLLELPSGEETQFSYGPLGQLQLLAAQLSGHEPLHFHYDERGQKISRHSKTGFQLQQHWDALGQLQQQFSSDYSSLHPAAPQPELNASIRRDYQHDTLGQVTQIIDQHLGQQNYQYNATGQITAAQHGERKEHYAYDATLNIASSAQQRISHPSAHNEASAKSATNANNNPGNNVTHIADWISEKGGAVKQQTSSTNGGQAANDYVYDARGRLIEKTTQLSLMA